MAARTRTRTQKPTPQAETPVQRLIRAFEAAVTDVASTVANADDTTTTTDIANAICARHAALALDPGLIRQLVIATCAVSADLLSRD